jgi:glycosyltransferase involved in cell wall biosynthesis
LVEYKYKIGVVKSDMGGCFQLRILQPFSELRRWGVDYTHTAFLPQRLSEPPEDTLVRWVEQFDLVVLQRCFKYEIFERLLRACRIAGRKLIFETDDDYINLPSYNPCHVEIHQPGVLDGFKEIIRQSDHITVTTQELKDVYYLYNQNISVLPNNVESIYPFKDEFHAPLGEGGKVPLNEVFGFVSYPSYVTFENPVTKQPELQKLFKVGYTATPTHRQDFLTIRPQFEKFLKKFPNTIVFYLGDPWFRDVGHPEDHKNVIYIPNQPYELYIQNIRNFDCGIAPLVPDMFNMSKSSLKLLEYGSWGIPAVAPNYITYSRHFEHNKTAMLYENAREFYDMMCEMAENHQKRAQIGLNAARMINDTRTERVNSQERFELYKSIIESTPPHKRFYPNKDKAIENAS